MVAKSTRMSEYLLKGPLYGGTSSTITSISHKGEWTQFRIINISSLFAMSRFYTLHSIYGRVDPLAEVDLSPPKTAQVTVVYNENFSDGSADMDSSGESLPDSRDITVNLNKSVKEFKQQLA